MKIETSKIPIQARFVVALSAPTRVMSDTTATSNALHRLPTATAGNVAIVARYSLVTVLNENVSSRNCSKRRHNWCIQCESAFCRLWDNSKAVLYSNEHVMLFLVRTLKRQMAERTEWSRKRRTEFSHYTSSGKGCIE